MALSHSPSTVTDGLVLCLDAANLKSYSTAENLLQHSQALATAPWAKIGANVTLTNNNAAAPDGTLTASLLNTTTFVSGDSVFQDRAVVGTGTYTLSVFVKAGTVSSLTLAAFYTGNSTQGFSFGFNASTGLVTGGSGSVESAGDGWYRIYFTVTGTNALNNTLRFQVYINTTGTLYLWGAQINVGSFVRPYTATTAAAITASTVWSNVSGQVNNGTLTNGPTYNTANAGAVVFDGVDDSVTVSTAPLALAQAAYTITAWFRANSNSAVQTIYEQNAASGNNLRSAMLIIGASWGFNGQGNDAHDKVPVRVGQWVYGAITVDKALGSNPIKIYENGQLYWQGDSTAGAANLSVGTAFTAIGRKVSNSEYFNGTVAAVAVYNRVLTALEIQQNFNALRGRYSI